jgi:thiamine-monophosphate kinase
LPPPQSRVALREVGEHAWLSRLVRRFGGDGARILVGPGDDAAVVRGTKKPLLLTIDALVEGVHFRRSWIPPGPLGRRAFAVNASDIAAMGGVPTFALLALEAPPGTAVAWLDALVAGVAAGARSAGARLVGGNVTGGANVAITLALVGEAPGRVVRRSGALPGDDVYVTGTLGAAGLAVRELHAGRPGRLPVPPSRLDAGRRLASHAHAMIDVSDGLLQDLGHVCGASGVAVEVALDRLPVAPACRRALGTRAARFAATAGEDYELVVVAPPRAARALARAASKAGCPLTQIGRVVAGRPEVRLMDRRGRRVSTGTAAGFDHFR